MIAVLSRSVTVFTAASLAVTPSVRAQARVAEQVAKDEQRTTTRNGEALSRLVTVTLDRVSIKAAVESLSVRAHVRISYRSEQINAAKEPVTLHVTGVSLKTALDRVLQGTGLYAVPVAEDLISIKAGTAPAKILGGVITGTVIDSHTQRPISGVAIRVDDATRGVLTDARGTFRISGVASGEHHVSARTIGYAKDVRVVTVQDGETSELKFSLDAKSTTLDQVVVTGTVVATELKAIPSAITVITAKDIEQRGITQIQQLFRGDVPGLFAYNMGSSEGLGAVTMFSRGATAIEGSSASTNPNVLATNPIKTYVDGVEMAQPQYLSQLDPRNIERIEILTGPQASTIYGSNALNGVMQIFTKRGTTSTPQITLNLLSGVIQNSLSSGLTPQHDCSATATGGDGKISYNAGGSWNYIGSWSPSSQSARRNAYGGVKLAQPTDVGNFTADVSLRISNTSNHASGGNDQLLQVAQSDGFWTVTPGAGLGFSTYNVLTSQTLGLTLSYAPTSWWSHEFGIGNDAEDTEFHSQRMTFFSPGDTTLYWAQSHAGRQSMHYNTTAQIPVTSFAHATFTIGGDGWHSVSTNASGAGQTLLDNPLVYPSIFRQTTHNAGAFFQGQLGFADRVFLTYGLRAEWNPNYGSDANPNYAPRYGIAYTTDLGPVTAKIRGSYGKSTRPPLPYERQGGLERDDLLIQMFGPHYSVLPNPQLGPEYQQGGEGGLELYLGNRASLVVTRYNQTVNGLITAVSGADSIRSLQPHPLAAYGYYDCTTLGSKDFCSTQDAQGYAYGWLRQNYNAANLRNQGWELQGSVTVGPLTGRGTYSWTESRTIGLTPKFLANALASNPYFFVFSPQFRPGATFKFLPEHTWAWSLTYAQGATTVALNVDGVGQLINRYNDQYRQELEPNIRLPENRAIVSFPGVASYVMLDQGYATADLNASRRITSMVEGVFQIQNVTNRFVNDFDARYAVMGRQSKAGLRVRF